MGSLKTIQRRSRLTHEDEVLYQSVLESGLISRLPKAKLGVFMRECTRSRKERFTRLKHPKYGDLPRHLEEHELERILSLLRDPVARMLFTFMPSTGTRIGEAVMVKVSDIAWGEKRIYLDTLKRGVPGWLVLTDSLATQLREWITVHDQEIRESGGYVFFTRPRWKSMQRTHADKNHMRNLFRDARKRAGVGREFGVSFERDPDRTPRTLCNITPHSSRHRFARKVRQATKDTVVIAHALRLANIQHVMRYARPTPGEIMDAVNDTVTIKLIKKRKPEPNPKPERQVAEELLLD